MLDIQLPNRTPDLVLMILLQQIIRLVIANIIPLCQIFINPPFKLPSDPPCSPDLIRLANINEQVRVVKIQRDPRRY